MNATSGAALGVVSGIGLAIVAGVVLNAKKSKAAAPPSPATSSWQRTMIIHPKQRARASASAYDVEYFEKSLSYMPGLGALKVIMSSPEMHALIGGDTVLIWDTTDALPADWPPDDPYAKSGAGYHLEFTNATSIDLDIARFLFPIAAWVQGAGAPAGGGEGEGGPSPQPPGGPQGGPQPQPPQGPPGPSPQPQTVPTPAPMPLHIPPGGIVIPAPGGALHLPPGSFKLPPEQGGGYHLPGGIVIPPPPAQGHVQGKDPGQTYRVGLEHASSSGGGAHGAFLQTIKLEGASITRDGDLLIIDLAHDGYYAPSGPRPDPRVLQAAEGLGGGTYRALRAGHTQIGYAYGSEHVFFDVEVSA